MGFGFACALPFNHPGKAIPQKPDQGLSRRKNHKNGWFSFGVPKAGPTNEQQGSNRLTEQDCLLIRTGIGCRRCSNGDSTRAWPVLAHGNAAFQDRSVRPWGKHSFLDTCRGSNEPSAAKLFPMSNHKTRPMDSCSCWGMFLFLGFLEVFCTFQELVRKLEESNQKQNKVSDPN